MFSRATSDKSVGGLSPIRYDPPANSPLGGSRLTVREHQRDSGDSMENDMDGDWIRLRGRGNNRKGRVDEADLNGWCAWHLVSK